jgi:hypothetical protein
VMVSGLTFFAILRGCVAVASTFFFGGISVGGEELARGVAAATRARACSGRERGRQGGRMSGKGGKWGASGK